MLFTGPRGSWGKKRKEKGLSERKGQEVFFFLGKLITLWIISWGISKYGGEIILVFILSSLFYHLLPIIFFILAFYHYLHYQHFYSFYPFFLCFTFLYPLPPLFPSSS